MSYWKRRQEETYKAGEMTVNQYFTKLEKAFNQAKRDLQKTVESFYWRKGFSSPIGAATCRP